MKTNPILEEIRQTRERLFAEAGNDPARFFAMMCEREAAAKARGAVVVPSPGKPCLSVSEDTVTYRTKKTKR